MHTRGEAGLEASRQPHPFAATMGDRKGEKGSEWAQEEELRAIVLADSFNERFMPATRDQPRVWLDMLVPMCSPPGWSCDAELGHILIASHRPHARWLCCATHRRDMRAHTRL